MSRPLSFHKWRYLFIGLFLIYSKGTAFAADALPVITSQSGNATVALGSAVNLSIAVTSETPVTYQWQVHKYWAEPNWTDIAVDEYALEGAHTAGLNVTNTSTLGWAGYTARFRCVVSNAGGTVYSEEIQLALYAPVPSIQAQPKAQTVIVGTPLYLLAKAKSYGANSTYQWLKNGEPIPGANQPVYDGSAYIIPQTQLSDTGEYRLSVTDSAGAVLSDEVEIRVVAPTPVKAVAANQDHMVYVRSDGTLWGTGYRWWYGARFEGDESTFPLFMADHVKKAVTSYLNTAYVKDDGTLWLVGMIMTPGVEGLYPEAVHVASEVIDVAADRRALYFIKADGSLWSMGANFYGQLGDGTTTNRTTPVQVATGVRAVVASGYKVLFIKSDDTLWAAGWNYEGALGDGTTINRSTPVQVDVGVRQFVSKQGLALTLYLKNDDTMWGLGAGPGFVTNGSMPGDGRPLQLTEKVIDVTGGAGQVLVVKPDGTLWARGDNYYGQLGDGTFATRTASVKIATAVTAVAASNYQSFFITTDGALWGMGKATTQVPGWTEVQPQPVLVAAGVQVIPAVPSQLSAGPGQDFVGVQLAWAAVLGASGYEVWRGLSSNQASAGKIATTGYVPTYRDTTGETGVTYYYWIKAINTAGAGGFSTLVSGTPSLMQPPVITTQPASLTAILGSRVRFTVGVTGVPAPTFKWQRLPVGSSTWADIVENPYSITYGDTTTASVFVMEGATLLGSHGDQFRCVVTNPSGSVTSAPATLSVARAGFTKLAAGRFHSLRLATDGTLVSAGANAYGQLGDGYTNDAAMPRRYFVTGRKIADMAAGPQHSLVVTETKELWGSGFNGTGQLGDGTTEARTLPVRLATDVVGAAAGFFHSAYLKSDGTLWLMGGNDSGQLGNGSTIDSPTPVQVATDVIAMALGNRQTLFLKGDGTLWGMGDLTDTGSPVHAPVQLSSNVRAVAAGAYHSLFVKQDGTLWALGYNGQGQLGTGDTITRTTPVQIDSNVQAVAAGYLHSAYLKNDNTLWVMGANGGGQLGDLSTTNRPTPFQLSTEVALVTASEAYTIFTQLDGTLRATGRNTYGQMGDWTTFEKTYPVSIETGVVFTPEAPTGVTATATPARDRVWVSWAPQGTATAFEVWRHTVNDAAGATRLATNLRWPVYEDRAVTTGQTYHYWIKAANPAGLSGYSEAGLASTLPLLAQAITFSGPGDQAYSGSAITLTGAASSGLALHYSVLAGPATLNGARLTPNGIGTVTLQVTQPGDSTYAAATPVVHSFTITKTPYTATLGNLAQVYNGTPRQVSIVLNDFIPMLIPVNGTTSTVTVTYNGSTTKPTDVGSYAVVAIIEQPTFTVTASDTLVITPASQTITFNALPDVAYGTAPIPLSATATSGLPVVFTVVAGPAVWQDDQLTLTGIGTVTVRAAQAGDHNRAAAPPVERTFRVALNLVAWTELHFTAEELANAATSGPAADPDGDGVTNLLEFALGLEPKIASTAGLPEASADGADWIYTYTRPRDRMDLTYEVQVSMDLITWTTAGVSHEQVSGGAIEIWRGRHPLGAAGNLFFRLKVSAL